MTKLLYRSNYLGSLLAPICFVACDFLLRLDSDDKKATAVLMLTWILFIDCILIARSGIMKADDDSDRTKILCLFFTFQALSIFSLMTIYRDVLATYPIFAEYGWLIPLYVGLLSMNAISNWSRRNIDIEDLNIK